MKIFLFYEKVTNQSFTIIKMDLECGNEFPELVLPKTKDKLSVNATNLLLDQNNDKVSHKNPS